MKKAVFLFFLCILFVTQSVGAVSTYKYTFREYEFRLTYYRSENDELGYYIEKLGVNPFYYDLVYENADISVNGVEEIKGNHYFYGSIHYDDNDSFYESFIIVIDENGNFVRDYVKDFGFDEEINGIYYIDSVIFVVTAQSTIEIMDYNFMNTIITKFDTDLNYLDEEIIPIMFNNVDATDRMLLLNTNYNDNFTHGLKSDMEWIFPNDSLMIPTNQRYSEPVQIDFLNEATLNGNQVYNGLSIEYPGNYVLAYNDFTYRFVVDSYIDGIEDNKIYSTPVIATVGLGNIFLNDDLYISGTEISEPGNYNLEVRGANNYILGCEFTITSNLQGVTHNHSYSEPVEVTFNGSGYLNNAFIESPYIISAPGDYILKIQGANNYLETYYFNIEGESDDVSFIDFIQKYDVLFLVITVITGYLIIKKKK